MITEVARRYAKALFEIAKENKIQEKVLAELRSLSEAIEADEKIQNFFASEAVPAENKLAVVKNALANKVSPVLVDTLKLMAENGRLEVLKDFAMAFEELIDASNGVTRGTVRSAKPLSAEARKKIEDTVTKVVKTKVILNFKEDPKLIAGMVAQVGGWTFDDTLETHLTHMSEDLNRRAH